MKKLTQQTLIPVFCLALIFGQVKNVSAQEWYQGRSAGIYSIGVGGTDGIGVGNSAFTPRNLTGGIAGRRTTYLGASINASGEYKVWKWVGVGWESGINIYPNKFSYGFGLYGGSTTSVAVEIPFIAKANFHILDATSVSIKDKLDVYAGLSFGAGPAFYTGNEGGGSTVYGVVHVGPQVGARYWINKKVAVFAEFGWGATFVNAGVTL